MRNRFEGSARLRVGAVIGMMIFAATLPGQQPPEKLQGGKPTSTQEQVQQQLIEIWRIELDPTGAAFSFGKPKLEGDVYVYRAWPEREIVRLPKAKVKGMTQRTKDLNKETVYVIDLLPTGRLLTREKPKLKAGSYQFHEYKNGALMSLRQADVKKVTLLTGMPAFRIQQEELGAALIDNLPMEGGGSVTVIPSAGDAPAAPAPAPAPAPGDGTNYGTPGSDYAHPPANATVESPGDVPKAPEPAPTPPPR